MKATHNSTLQQAPKRLDVVGMDISAHVFALFVIHGLVRIEMFQIGITDIFVSCDQADLICRCWLNLEVNVLF